MPRSELTRRRFLALSASTLAGAAITAACGSGDDEDDATPTATAEPTEPEPTATQATSTATTEATETETAATATATATAEVPTPTEAPAGTGFEALALPPGPAARRDHAMAASRAGTLYIHGGRAAGASLADFWAYDQASGAWTQLSSDGPAARFGHNLAYDEGSDRLVMFGGQGDSGFFDDTWAFDAASNTWTRLAEGMPGPAARYGAGHAYDIDAQLFYVSHGFTANGRFDDTWALDLQDDTWRDISPPAGQPRPVKRCLHRTVWNEREQKLVLFGGQTDGTPFLGDTWEFDPKGSVWTQVEVPGPEPRTFYAAAYHRNSQSVVVATGNAGGSPVGDAWIYRDRLWGKLDAAIDGREGADMVLAGDGSLLLWGGATARGEVAEAFRLTVAEQAFSIY
jgi:N-acetylneuraminic acid mutarotase